MHLLARLKPSGSMLATLTIALGGFLNGYDTGSIGAVTVMPQFRETMGPISPGLVGITIAIIMLGGAVPAFFAGQLADRYGRLAVISTGAACFGVGCLLQASSFSLGQFIAGRLIAGIGEGTYLGVGSV